MKKIICSLAIFASVLYSFASQQPAKAYRGIECSARAILGDGTQLTYEIAVTADAENNPVSGRSGSITIRSQRRNGSDAILHNEEEFREYSSSRRIPFSSRFRGKQVWYVPSADYGIYLVFLGESSGNKLQIVHYRNRTQYFRANGSC